MAKKKKYVKKIHFKSSEAYRKWLAYNFIHHPKEMLKAPHKIVFIRGKKHKVKHNKKKIKKKKR